MRGAMSRGFLKKTHTCKLASFLTSAVMSRAEAPSTFPLGEPEQAPDRFPDQRRLRPLLLRREGTERRHLVAAKPEGEPGHHLGRRDRFRPRFLAPVTGPHRWAPPGHVSPLPPLRGR